MEVVGEDVRSHLSAWIRAPPTISEETASRLHLVERGKKNVRVSRASCVEWSDARESVFMVCGRRPRRVLKLRSRKTDAVRKLSIHHSPLLFTSQTHVCSDTGAAHDQRRHTLAISSCQWLFFSAHGGVRNQIDAGVGREYEQIRAPPMTFVLGMQQAGEDVRRHLSVSIGGGAHDRRRGLREHPGAHYEMRARPWSDAIFANIHAFDIRCSRSVVLQPPGRTPAMVAQGTRESFFW